jgi:hypothetical protein
MWESSLRHEFDLRATVPGTFGGGDLGQGDNAGANAAACAGHESSLLITPKLSVQTDV